MIKRVFWARPIITQSHFFKLCLKGEESLDLSQGELSKFQKIFADVELRANSPILWPSAFCKEFRDYEVIDSGNPELLFAAKAFQQSEGKQISYFYKSLSVACDAVMFTPFPILQGSGVSGYCIDHCVAFAIDGAFEKNPDTPIFMLIYNHSRTLDDDVVSFVNVDWANKITKNGDPITVLDKDRALNALSFYGYTNRS